MAALESAWNVATAWAIFFGAAVVACGVGVVYYVRADHARTIWLRVLTSLYAPAFAALFIAAIFWPDRYRYRPGSVTLFNLLHVVPLALLAGSIWRYPGPKSLHRRLVPLAAVCAAWMFALGWLLVHGE
jgi:hypothetical protein